MNRWASVAAAVGLFVLAAVLWQTDLRAVGEHLRRLSAAEVFALMAIYFSGRLGGVVSWLLTMPVPASPRWLLRLLRVHLVGGAVERVTPLAGMGGEPIKAVMLKRDYGVGVRDATASLALTRMTDLVAIILFSAFGLLLVSLQTPQPLPLRRPASAALAFLFGSALCAALAQRYRLLSHLAPRLARRLPARLGGPAAQRLVAAVVEVESRMLGAYTQRPWRMALSVLSTFFEWCLEAYLIYLALAFLDVPVAMTTAVSIAAFALVVRSAFFFVPADIGTQEAALVGICQAFVSSATVGLAIAAVLRLGELLWTLCGVGVGLRYISGGRSREVLGERG